MRYMVATVTGFLKKARCNDSLAFIYFCGKFHTDTINRTVFGKEFVKLVYRCLPDVAMALPLPARRRQTSVLIARAKMTQLTLRRNENHSSTSKALNRFGIRRNSFKLCSNM